MVERTSGVKQTDGTATYCCDYCGQDIPTQQREPMFYGPILDSPSMRKRIKNFSYRLEIWDNDILPDGSVQATLHMLGLDSKKRRVGTWHRDLQFPSLAAAHDVLKENTAKMLELGVPVEVEHAGPACFVEGEPHQGGRDDHDGAGRGDHRDCDNHPKEVE